MSQSVYVASGASLIATAAIMAQGPRARARSITRVPTTHLGAAMTLINADESPEPGLNAYIHVSDQFGPAAPHNIPATVNEVPYILLGL